MKIFFVVNILNNLETILKENLEKKSRELEWQFLIRRLKELYCPKKKCEKKLRIIFDSRNEENRRRKDRNNFLKFEVIENFEKFVN